MPGQIMVADATFVLQGHIMQLMHFTENCVFPDVNLWDDTDCVSSLNVPVRHGCKSALLKYQHAPA